MSQQVPVERVDMADVKNDPVALVDGPVVHGLILNDLKDVVGASAGFHEPGLQVVTDADGAAEYSHAKTPLLGCRFRPKDAPNISAGRQNGYDVPSLIVELSIEMKAKTAPQAESYHSISRCYIQDFP